MKIEYILIGLILLIFLFDIIRKKNNDSTEEVVNPEAIINKPNWFLSLFVLTLIGVFVGLIVDFITNNSYDSNGNYHKNIFEYVKNFRYTEKALINYFISLLSALGVGIFLIKTKELKFITYLLKRKKNISLLIIFIPFFKVLLHYILYPIMTRDCINCGGRIRDRNREITYTEKYRDSFGKHFDKIIEDELWLFIPAIIAPLFIIWFFNDKIKAR